MLKEYIVEKLNSSSVDDVASLIVSVFMEREPLAMLDSSDGNEFKVYLTNLGTRAAQTGMSLVARCRFSNRVVGAVICADLAGAHHGEDEGGDADPIEVMVEKLNSDYFGQTSPESGQYFSIKFIAASADFTGQGMVTDLIEQSLQIAQEKGFVFAHTEASGNISQHMFMNKFGFVEKNAIAYSEFTLNDAQPFAAVQGHKGIKLLIKSL
ncbi:GNAT family N-acetyltransferase [Parendozoicomonas haliclonae]|uniref:N-acetyltransferase domain-containing protein n=1 Tax=Parendozoicomonas haliclonae TaxID=1960125 RepID=A0A1X7AF26_9GAMM|nr:GNAT family N-acetyltransferase [Parendozoicomonas haliclonae]SMA34621.1 hypothetical protein EHSB41UT_00425 [Parendozoicomonas haliclonae]